MVTCLVNIQPSRVKVKGLLFSPEFLLFFFLWLILLDLLPSLLPSPRAIETLLIELPSLGVLVDERLFSYSTARVRNYVEAMSAKISLSPI